MDFQQPPPPPAKSTKKQQLQQDEQEAPKDGGHLGHPIEEDEPRGSPRRGGH